MHNCQGFEIHLTFILFNAIKTNNNPNISKTAWTTPIGFESIPLIPQAIDIHKLNVKRVIPLLLLLAIGGLQAEPRYITDQTHITMRSGEDASHKIQRMLPAGEKVELLSSNSKSSYSKIRDSKGILGFVLTSQLMTAPSARNRVNKAEQKYAEMKQKMDQALRPYQELQQKHRQLAAEHNKLKSSKTNTDSKLKEIKYTSADTVRISEERRELIKKLASQTWELENLKQDYRELKNERSQYWFLIGGGVVILGIIIGMILPRLQSSNKKQAW